MNNVYEEHFKSKQLQNPDRKKTFEHGGKMKKLLQ